MSRPLTILVSGMIAGVPGQGGAAWAVLQYLLGFQRLGQRVYFLEPVDHSRLRPEAVPFASSANANYFRQVMNDFGLGQTSALWLTGTQETVGLPFAELRQVVARCDLFLNLSGMLAEREWFGRIPVRVYVDLDPAFTQLWQAVQGIDMRFAHHTHHVTVGPTIGQPGCPIPTGGFHWLSTLPPVVLDHWPVANEIAVDGLTTVGHWRGYGSIEYDGIFYGQKAHSFRRFLTLPTQTRERLLPALAIHPGETQDLKELERNHWTLLDPAEVADTPGSYRRFVQGSRAELGIAKSGYVASRCGWFSDRSACYLASGRPVLAQETGFSRFLPTGGGLLAFETMEDLVEKIGKLRKDYPSHARAARMIAEDYLDSDKVLRRLLSNVGVAA